MVDNSIFIHSLFRAGSTYLFSVFRRSESGYKCYQEPLHELSFLFRNEPSLLQIEHSNEKSSQLRHPDIKGSYFKELIEAWPVWKEVIEERTIYDAYFLINKDEVGIPYWQALAAASSGRPVFQECRTSGRIGAIKSHMGGTHLYLWRNPWDQWWSYKVTSYFALANQLILHASHPPKPLQQFLKVLSLPSYEGKDLEGALLFYGERLLSSEQSYLGFYLLWCLALREATQHAHILINIDALSDSLGYREEMIDALGHFCIDGIGFNDCRITQGHYLDSDQEFFKPLEDRVHQWLIEGGWTQEELNEIRTLRQQYSPASWSQPIMSLSSADLAEQASRLRMLAISFESNAAAQARYSPLELRIQAAQAEAKAQQAEAKAQQAEAKAQQAEAKAQQAEAKAQQAEAKAQQAEAAARALVNSRVWRATKPLRPLVNVIRRLCIRLRKPLFSRPDTLIVPTMWHVRDSPRLNNDLLSLVRLRLICDAKQMSKVALRQVLRPAISFFKARPHLKRTLQQTLRSHPRIEQRLRLFAVARGLASTGNVQSAIRSSRAHTLPMHLTHLTPRACQIYSDLKVAIERNRQEDR